MNRSLIRLVLTLDWVDFGDEGIQGVTGFLFNMAESHG